MANKKILISNNDGKIKEIASGSGLTSTYFDDVTNTLIAKNISFNTMSLNVDGLPIITNQTVSVKQVNNFDTVIWDNINKTWTTAPVTEINVTSPPQNANGDLTGTMDAPLVKSLTNVFTGVLPVSRGGTGLSNTDFTYSGESLLIGNSTNKFTLLTASQSTSSLDVLVSDGSNWRFITQSFSGDVEVQVYSSPGTYTWTKPDRVKSIRILAQGGGGGGGSGANRNTGIVSLGGTGGSAGAFVDSGFITVDDSTYQIIVGSGGLGAYFPTTNSSGIGGADGQSTYFGNILTASGGGGGVGGNLSSTTSAGGSSTSPTVNVYNTLSYDYLQTKLNGGSGGSNTTSLGAFSTYYSNRSSGGGGGASLSAVDYTTTNNGGGGIDSNVRVFLDGESIYSIANLNNYLSIVGNVTLDSANKKFGNKSLKFTAGSRAQLIGYNDLSTIGSGDYTVEMWIYLDSAPTETQYGSVVADLQSGTAASRALIQIGYSTLKPRFSNGANALISDTAITIGSWHHIALVRKSGILYWYINGVKQTTTKVDTASYFDILYLGNPNNVVTISLFGRLDHFKIHKQAIYTESFTPATSPTDSYIKYNGGLIGSIDAQNAYTSSITSSIYDATFPQDVFLASGGGGGASATVTQSFDTSLINLFHLKNGEDVKDYSLYNFSVTPSTYTIIPSPVGLPGAGSNFTDDGVLSSSYVVANNSAFYLSPTTPFTYQGWYYLTSTGSAPSSGGYTSGFATLGTAASPNNVGIFTNGTGIRIWGTSAWYTPSPAVNIPLNTWFHLAVVRTANNTIRVHVSSPSGITSGSITNFPVGTAVSGGLYIGNTGISSFVGYAKEVKFNSSASSVADITSYYNAVVSGTSGSFQDPSPLLSYPGGLGGNGTWGSGGGGGGASTNYTGSNLTQYDMETISLRHFNLQQNSILTDSSIHKNTVNNTRLAVVSTASQGISNINAIFPDGVLSSSAVPQLLSGVDGTYVVSKTNVTDNFTVESWVYLKDVGSSLDNNLKCSLIGVGYTTSTTGLLLGVNNSSQLAIWAGNGTTATISTGSVTLPILMNRWNHVVLQKSGGTNTMYLNGTASVVSLTTVTTNNNFTYGLGNSFYSQYNFNGYAKEFVVTNRIKTASEIQNYYNAVIGNQSGSYQDPSDKNTPVQGGNGGNGYVAVISYKY